MVSRSQDFKLDLNRSPVEYIYEVHPTSTFYDGSSLTLTTGACSAQHCMQNHVRLSRDDTEQQQSDGRFLDDVSQQSMLD